MMKNTKKQKIIDFVSRHQPCKYNFILKSGQFRRNTLKAYIEDLEKENKLIKMNNLYFLNPPNKELLKKFIDEKKIVSTLQNFKQYSELSIRVSQIIMNRLKKEPIRTRLAIGKIRDNSDILDKIGSDFWEFVLSGYYEQLENFKNMTKKEELTYFSKSLKLVDLHTYFEFLNEFDIHFKSYPRFEYPKFKHQLHDREYNTGGIDPRFQAETRNQGDDKKPNYDRLEEVYSNRLLANSLRITDENGDQLYLYIGNTFGYQAALFAQLKQGKVSFDEFNRTYLDVLHNHPPKILKKIPENQTIRRILGYELPKGLSIDDLKGLLKNPEFSHHTSVLLFSKISELIQDHRAMDTCSPNQP